MNSLAADWPMYLAILVVASWVCLALVSALAVFGTRPLARRGVLPIVRGATVFGVFGLFMAVALSFYFMVSLSHFDTGIPEEQKQPLAVAVWGAAIAGLVIGGLAARRLGRRSAHPGR